MAERGNGEWSGPDKSKFLILYKSLAEWSALLYQYVDGSGQMNSVFTVYELLEGDDTTEQEFYGMVSVLFGGRFSTHRLPGASALHPRPRVHGTGGPRQALHRLGSQQARRQDSQTMKSVSQLLQAGQLGLKGALAFFQPLGLIGVAVGLQDGVCFQQELLQRLEPLSVGQPCIVGGRRGRHQLLQTLQQTLHGRLIRFGRR